MSNKWLFLHQSQNKYEYYCLLIARSHIDTMQFIIIIGSSSVCYIHTYEFQLITCVHYYGKYSHKQQTVRKESQNIDCNTVEQQMTTNIKAHPPTAPVVITNCVLNTIIAMASGRVKKQLPRQLLK